MGINKVILVGRLGKEPEILATSSGSQVVKFSLATSEKYKNKDGKWIDNTEWHRIVCFGKLAELASKYLSKGREVYLEGKIKTSKYKAKDGSDRYSTDITANTIEFLGNKEDNQMSEQTKKENWEKIDKVIAPDAPTPPDFDPDKLPF